MVLEHSDGGWRAELQLVWLPEEAHFLLVGFTVHVPLDSLRSAVSEQGC